MSDYDGVSDGKLLDTETDGSTFEDAPLQSEMGESDYDGPDDETYKQKKPTVMRLLRFGKPELPLVISATFLASISAFLHMSQNIFVGMVINAVHYSSLNAGKSAVTTFTLYLLCIYVADCMLTLFSSVLYTIAATRCSCRLRTLVLRNMLRQDVAFFDTVRVGELLNRLSTDTEVIQMVVTANLAGWFIPLCQVVIGLIAIFTYNWKLTLVVLSLIPVIAVCMFLQGFCMKILTEQELIALADAGSKADETLSNIRTVRSYVMEEKEISHYADKINISYLIIKRRAWIAGGLSSITNLAGDSCILVAMWYGGQLIFQNQMSVGGLVSYMLFALQSVFAFSSLISIFPQFMEAIGASGRIFELLDRVPAVNYDGGFIAPNGIEGHIKFQDVHFHYPSRPKIKIMNGLSIDLPPGKTLALVGASGCGKSTFIYLLERFYDCQGGSILIDGMDILKYDPQWLRDQVGLVQQEPVLFAMSIEDNIMYGSKICTHARVEQAARLANAHDFIQALPQGYDAQCGERGVMLSGGQKQRIAIARALLKDPKILLLDEATSSLDAESEKLVQEALDRLMVGRTSIVIAHRLSTIVDSDQIIVVQNGRIVERGTHDELIRMNGVYKRLGRRQFNLKNEDKEKSSRISKEAADPAQDMSSAVETIRRTLQQRRRNNSVQQVAARVQQMRTEPERLKVLVRELQTMETKFQETSTKIAGLAKGGQ
jgi:ATP-binding cassette subfamily B protein